MGSVQRHTIDIQTCRDPPSRLPSAAQGERTHAHQQAAVAAAGSRRVAPSGSIRDGVELSEANESRGSVLLVG